MGKPTGFMDYARRDNRVRPPLERVRDWEEFHLPCPPEERKKQGARCMNCGVPFCQAGVQFEGKQLGCPLHNLIPEWNDAVMDGNFPHALTRLLKTNNFPEFTGRVCPAFCEQACTCGVYGDAVTVHDNELSVIEYAFQHHLMEPRFSPHASGKNVAVVGSGPAGLAAADQLNHRGHSVTVIEKRDLPGGLLMYGIPNMKLPKAVVRRRIELMTREGVSFVTGVDASDPAVARRLLTEYDAVILCCGAEKPRPLGLDADGVGGVLYAMDFLPAAVERQQFSLSPAVPSAEGKNVIVVGTGNTASDCVATSLRQGCVSVKQLVRRPREDYLRPDGSLPQDYAQEEAAALFGEDPRLFSQSVASLETDGGGALSAVFTKDGTRLPCELLIAATGFAGCREEICAAFGVETERTVKTEAGSYRTGVPHVFTAGDMRRGQSLVVHAIAEGRACAAEVDRFLMGYTNLI